MAVNGWKSDERAMAGLVIQLMGGLDDRKQACFCMQVEQHQVAVVHFSPVRKIELDGTGIGIGF